MDIELTLTENKGQKHQLDVKHNNFLLALNHYFVNIKEFDGIY